MQKIGIVLGAGPQASSFFYLKMISDYRLLYGNQPELLLYNLPIELEVENMFLSNSKTTISSYVSVIEKCLMFMKSNEVDAISFPCFSLSQYMEEKCKVFDIKFINPFDALNNIQNQKIGILTAHSRDEFSNYIDSKISKELEFPHQHTKEIQGVIKSIVKGNEPSKYKGLFNNIELTFSRMNISEYLIACSELCIIQFQSKMKSINLLDILVKKTIEEIRK